MNKENILLQIEELIDSSIEDAEDLQQYLDLWHDNILLPNKLETISSKLKQVLINLNELKK